jgi:PIN domain nuclease of toxin-antitoxin system
MIVLDTHAFLWLAADPERLSTPAREVLDREHERAISVVSAQEISYLAMRGRIAFDRPTSRWIRDALDRYDIQACEIDLPIAVRAGALDSAGFPGDPADRAIYATVLQHDALLVSADERLRDVDPARVIW